MKGRAGAITIATGRSLLTATRAPDTDGDPLTMELVLADGTKTSNELDREAQRIQPAGDLRPRAARLFQRRHRARRTSAATIAGAIFLIPALPFIAVSQRDSVPIDALRAANLSQTATPQTAALGSNLPECASEDDATVITSVFADSGFESADEAIRAALMNEGVEAASQSEPTEIPSGEGGRATYRVELTEGRVAVVALRTGQGTFVLDGVRLCG